MGEAKKKRAFCPVKQGPISPSDCGEHRVSRYPCPESCPANPWSISNYGQYLDMESRARNQALQRLGAEMRRSGRTVTIPRTEGLGTETFMMLMRNFYGEKDARGQTFQQRWEASGFEGLNNDQRVYQRAAGDGVFTLLEIRRVLDSQSCLAVDLLDGDPEPFLLADRTLASQACRFDVLLARLIRLPHFRRIDSITLYMPLPPGWTPVAVLREYVRHLGGPDDPAAIRDWLFGHFTEMEAAIQAVARVNTARRIRGTDTAFTHAEYRLDLPAETLRDRFGNEADLVAEAPSAERAAEGFTDAWTLLGGKGALGFGRSVLGLILLHRDSRLRLEVFGTRQTTALKDWLEKQLGDSIRFVAELSEDLVPQADAGDSVDLAGVPPALIGETHGVEAQSNRIVPDDLPGEGTITERFLAHYLLSYPDTEIPALDGRTPRQAAADPILRERLLCLVKELVCHHDRQNLQSGTKVDINGLIRELGLHEIDFPPPPFRAPPVSEESDEGEEADVWDEEDRKQQWTAEDVLDRIDELLADYSPGFLDASVCLRFPDLHAILEESFPSPASLETLEGLTRLSCVLLLHVHYPPDDKAMRRLDPSLTMDFYLDVVGDLTEQAKNPDGSLVDKIAEWPETIRGISIWMLEKSRERSLPGNQDKQWSLFLHHALWLDRVVSYWTYG
jgi:hypothetical protein